MTERDAIIKVLCDYELRTQCSFPPLRPLLLLALCKRMQGLCKPIRMPCKRMQRACFAWCIMSNE